ncbi:hypothetical protein [Dyadobacter fermentans]|uniref:hypothetical protein n=1 Tax=Dyadobacter fermentans TaxID=94254 RepID=UPI001CC03497|nr:hypothetical protein [Dyadobacter fermentans]MBZ1362012.1 hypothetical protein [Dyadobacter fermentans]
MKFGTTKTEEEELEEYSAEGMRKRLAAAYTAWRDEVTAKLEPVVYPNHAWVVYAGSETQHPQAAFTNREYAEILASHMQGAIDPVLRERSEIAAMNIRVDKYKEQVSFGKMPYEIILRKDGEVFDAWGPEDGMPSIDTPKVSESERHILGGTFWGWTKGEAIEEAQKLLEAMKAAGDI